MNRMRQQARSIVAVAAMAAVAMLAVFALPVGLAGAQTTALVSNLGQTGSGGSGVSSVVSRAQGFTTGNNAGGYTLASIDVDFASVSSTQADLDAVVADLYSVSGSAPGTKLQTLTNPNTIAAGTNTFTAPAGVMLTPNTKYFIVISCTSAGFLNCVSPSRTVSGSEDSGAAMGWSIDNTRYSKSGSGSWSSVSAAHRIRVNGEAAAANAAPVFSSSATTYRVAENSTTVATLTATDADTEDTSFSYALSGVDAGKFTISSTGALAFSSAPNHEDPQDVQSTTPSDAADNNVYVVTVTVTSGTGDRAKTAERTLKITVTDVSEPPGKPATPTVSATTENSVTVGWSPPTNTGPDITGYTVRRVNGSTTITANVAASARSHTFTGLSPGIAYEVSVFARNAEGAGSYSDAVTATTTALPSISIARKSTTAASVAEGTTPVFVVTASRAPSSNLTVKLTVAEATGRDFVASTNEGNKTISISTTETSKEFSFATVNDNVDEPDGTVTVTVAAGTGYGVGSPSSASVTITDNDATPTVTLTLTPASIDESGTSNRSTVTASLDRASSETTTITVSAAAVSPATSSDFALTSNKKLTIAAGATTSTGTVRITATNNNADEVDKTVTVSGAATNSHAITGPTSKTLTIVDDDTVGVVVSRTTTLNVPEAGSATYSVKLATQPTANVVITPDSDDDTSATVSTARSDNTLVFTTSNWATNQTITVRGVNDAKDNVGNKRDVEITHTATSTDASYNGITIAAVDVDVIDDDANNRPTFATGTASAYEFAENTAATTAVTTFSASDIDDQDSITGYSLSGADASKFSITDAGVLTFNASPNHESPTDSGTNNVYNLTVRVNSGDSSATPSRATSRTLAVTVTVTDVDEPPAFSAAATNQSVTEDNALSYVAPAATDPEGATVTYSAAQSDDTALPSWLSFNATTRTFSGTPREADTPATLTIRITATDATSNSSFTDFTLSALEDNDAPSFTDESKRFSVEENTTTVGTVVANDPDHGDTITGYRVNAAFVQSALFEIDDSGNLTFKAAPNFEAPAGNNGSNTYLIWVIATSDASGGGRSKTKSATIQVTVTDDDTEAPSAPSPSATTTFQSIDVTWAEPANAGPAITGYDVRYKLMSATNYPSSPQLTVTTLSATINTGLTHDTAYHVQVRAKNAEGASAYSTAITATTKRNVAPVISTSTTSYNVNENSTAAVVTLAAADADNEDSISAWALSGTDAALFSINQSTGALSFASAPNYEDPKDSGTNNVYDVVATVTGGTGARAMTDSITLAITVQDVNEPPSKPAAPTVATSTVTSITFAWSPPANTGPPITGYNVGWRVSGVGSYTPLAHTGTTPRAQITGLTQNTTYQFRVQATNDEGTGTWSDPGSAQAKAYDKYGFVVTPTAIAICEDSADAACSGKPNTFTVSLQKAPTADVKLEPTFHSVRGSVSPETLTFTTLNWHLPQTVTVTGAQDDIAWRDGATARVRYIKTTTDTEYKKVSPKGVTVTMYDDDTAGVEIDTNPSLAGVQNEELSVIEGRSRYYEGGLATYTVRLTSQPAPGQTIRVEPRISSGGGIIGPRGLTFTEDNWNVPRTVGFSAGRDHQYSFPNRVTVISHSLGTARGVTYWDIAEPDSVRVEIAERDRAFVVSPNRPINVTQDLTRRNDVRQHSISVRMTTQPTANVIITLVSTDTTVAPISPSSLTFTPNNWNQNQYVTVTTDSKVLGSSSITLSPTDVTSTDTRFTTVNAFYDPISFSVQVCVFGREDLIRVRDEAKRVGWDNVQYCTGVPAYNWLDEEEGTLNAVPYFDASLGTALTLAENSPAGTSVGSPIAATDFDEDDTLTYSLSGADAASFAIDSATGQISTVAGVSYDYEARSYLAEPAYSLAVEVSDGRGGNASIAVTVTLTDVDDDPEGNWPPAFHAGTEITLTVAENSPAGTKVGSPITAYDPNGDTLGWYEGGISGADGAAFSLGADGQLTTAAGATFDYEDKPSYRFTVIVEETDTAGGYLAAIWVTVNLTDVTEPNEPNDGIAGGVVSTPLTTCKTDAGTLTATARYTGDWSAADCRAHHQDSRARYVHFTLAEAAEVTVSLSAGSLYISSDTRADWGKAPKGTYEHRVSARKANGKLVHEGLSSTTRTLAAGTYTAEAAGTSGDFTLDIELPETEDEGPSGDEGEDGDESQESKTEAANTAPSFGSGVETTLTVDENSGSGANVGSPITATDPDEGDTLTYSLSGADASSFEISSTTGQITTKTGVTYDYEAKPSYTLAVKVSDGKLTDSTPVTVNLNNVNEAPAFSEGASATRAVKENSAAGTNVGSAVTAADPDTGDTLTYTLSGTDASSFDINSTTGQITTKTGVTYDYETTPSYTLVVAVADSSGLTDSIAITVNLTDVTETTPTDDGPSGDGTDDGTSDGGTDEAQATAVTACETDLGTLSASALYAGSWDDADCKAHHQDSRARYFKFKLAAGTDVTITLTSDADAALYVSKDDANNGWGSVPGPGYDHRKSVRRTNGKLVYDGPGAATATNDGNTVTLTLKAGITYTVEAAATTGDFTLTLTPQ